MNRRQRLMGTLFSGGDSIAPTVAITCTQTLNGVTIGHETDTGGASLFLDESWLHYIDNTHANILDSKGDPGFTALNVSGFNWSSAQTCAVAQGAVVAQHVIVGAIISDLMPKGLL